MLGSVSSSLVAVSFIRIMSSHHCPIILSSSYMPSNSAASSLARSVDNTVYSFVDSGIGFAICYGGRFVGVQFGGIERF